MKPLSEDLPELELMRQGVDYLFPVQIRKWRVSCRPVTVGEHMAINNEIIEELARMSDIMRNSVNESYLLAKAMLKRASSEPPPSTKQGPITDYLLDAMTVDEVLFAYKQYEDGVDKVNPRFEELSIDDLRALVDAVKKKESVLTDLSFSQLASMARYLLTQGG